MVVGEPVARPLPDVAGDVVEPVSVGWEAADRRCSIEAIELEVLPRELALPAVRHRLALRKVVIAPGERGTLEPASRRELPFRLCRKLLARPTRVRLDILVGDMDDGVAIASVDGAARPRWALPVRAGH